MTDGASATPWQQDFADQKRPLYVAILGRRRWQIILGLLIAVLLPAFIRWPDYALAFKAHSANSGVYETAAALLIGYFIIRKMSVFPGLQVFALILPAFSISYGLMAAELLLTRQDYSRLHIVVSFALAVVFYHYAFLVERRYKRPRFAVVSGGHVSEVMESDRVDWTIWSSADSLPLGFDGVVADLRADMGPAWEFFLAQCALAGIPVYHSKQVHESLTGMVAIEHLSENTLGSLISSSIYAHWKLITDVAAAVILLPFAAAICAVAGILIKLDSRGPILFVQERVGYRGRMFRMYKLRTMYIEEEGLHYTAAKDPRITKVGAVLRKFRIDELPQTLNILKGEMSWIGPRPEAISLSEWYGREIAFYSYRHIVRPGVTGWAQVNQGNVAKPDMVRFKLHYDFYYIKHFSPWLDLVIIAQTVRTILTGFGAH